MIDVWFGLGNHKKKKKKNGDAGYCVMRSAALFSSLCLSQTHM